MTAEEREALAAALAHHSWCTYGQAMVSVTGAVESRGQCNCLPARQQDADALAPVVDAIARRKAAGAVQPFRELFAGGPDTACRTTWRDPLSGRAAEVRTTECVEVPIEDLRDAFDRADALEAE